MWNDPLPSLDLRTLGFCFLLSFSFHLCFFFWCFCQFGVVGCFVWETGCLSASVMFGLGSARVYGVSSLANGTHARVYAFAWRYGSLPSGNANNVPPAFWSFVTILGHRSTSFCCFPFLMTQANALPTTHSGSRATRWEMRVQYNKCICVWRPRRTMYKKYEFKYYTKVLLTFNVFGITLFLETDSIIIPEKLGVDMTRHFEARDPVGSKLLLQETFERSP